MKYLKRCNDLHQRLVSAALPPSVGGVCSSVIFPQIRLMALCMTCVFAVTLSVFPVITVRVRTVYKDDVTWGEFHS